MVKAVVEKGTGACPGEPECLVYYEPSNYTRVNQKQHQPEGAHASRRDSWAALR